MRRTGKHPSRPRLSREEETSLGIRALAGDFSSRNKLIESCAGLAYHLASAPQLRNYVGIELDDLEQEALTALCVCAGRFDPVRHPGIRFSTFAWACIVGLLMTYCEKNRRRELTNLDMDMIVDPASLPPSFEERDADVVWTVVEKLSREELGLLDLRYGLNGGPHLTFEEIGTRMSLSRQRVHQKVGVIIEKLGQSLRTAA